ncbi:MAG: leucine-rich repeat protein [Bacteroidetes bacterium]|nr:leucine-rich repeat protein [Bacteroidota bacterium]
MNKLFFSCPLVLVLLMLPFAGYSQVEEDAGIDGYENITEALQHPEKAKKVWITGNGSQLNLLTSNAAAFKNLQAFKIRDAASEKDWDKLFLALSKISSIKEIELTFNEISQVPASIAAFKNLQTLIIWGSPALDYTALFRNLAALDKLNTLELNSNSFGTVPAEIKELRHLERFSITDNEAVNYADLMEKLSVLPLLKALSLEVNAITQLPANIIKLKSLTRLNISNNYIASFPERMSELKNLDSLQADGNLFVNYVDEYNKLKGLNISYLSVDGGLTDEEKAELLKLFPKVKVDEQASAEAISNPGKQDLFTSPVPALAVPKAVYIVDAASGGQLDYTSGSQISIPKDAFVDKDNKAVKGNVRVSYREFSDPFDIAFSGIPMSYSNKDSTYPMESAGMFQINASQGDQPVFLKKGKAIDVSMITSDTTDNYNMYRIDTATKEWVNEGKRGTIKIVKPKDYQKDSLDYYGSKVVELSPAWRRYNDIIHADDTVLFKDRFYDTSYCHLTKTALLKNNDYFRYVRVYRYKKESSLNRKAEKGEIWFNIKNILRTGDNPEIRAFNGMAWVYEGDASPKEFSARYLRRKRYSDIRIEQNGDSFTILLKEKDGILSIPAHPVNKFKGSAEKPERTYARRYRNYTKALARREAQFNRDLARKRQSAYRYNQKVWQNLKPVMSDSEKVMTFDQWMRYYSQMLNNDTITKFQKSSGFVGGVLNQSYRKISVTQFGYYNCDRPLLKIIALPVNAVDAVVRSGYKAVTEPKEYAGISVTYFDMQDKRLAPKQVMIVDKRIKSVAYVGNGASMRIAVNSPKNLIAVMGDGSVGVFSENRFKEINLVDKGEYGIKLVVYGPNDLEQLRRYLKY